MNFPLLQKLLWKIHFMLVYSSKIHDWTVIKRETWLSKCEKSPDMVKPAGILESSLPPTFGLPVILDRDLLPAEGMFWLFLCQVTGKQSEHMYHILWHTEEYILEWGRAVGAQISGFCIYQHSRLYVVLGDQLGNCLISLKAPTRIFFSYKGVPASITLLLLMWLLN